MARETGTIQRNSAKNNFIFIRRPSGEDLYALKANIRNCGDLLKDAALEYEVMVKSDGRLQAINIIVSAPQRASVPLPQAKIQSKPPNQTARPIVPAQPLAAKSQANAQKPSGILHVDVQNALSLKPDGHGPRVDLDYNSLPETIRDLRKERAGISVRYESNAAGAISGIEPVNQTPVREEAALKFLHPYYFIPPAEAPARATPHGHASFVSNHYSGKLRIKMAAITPLLVPDAAQYSESDGHKTFSTRVGADGKPLIAATSVKGMLRSAFEIITSSRMSVFSGHERRLGYRQRPQESLCLWPARITVNGDQIGVELFAGHATAVCLPRGHQANTHEFAVLGIAQNSRAPSAWWEKYLGDPNQKTYARRNEHGSAVFADIADMPRDGLPISRATNVVNANGAIKSATQIEGWGSITNRSFSRKHDERVFSIALEKFNLPPTKANPFD